jgi:hypothetical protein
VRKGFILRKPLNLRAQLFVVRRLRRSGWAGDGAAAVFPNEIPAGLFIRRSIPDGLKPIGVKLRRYALKKKG